MPSTTCGSKVAELKSVYCDPDPAKARKAIEDELTPQCKPFRVPPPSRIQSEGPSRQAGRLPVSVVEPPTVSRASIEDATDGSLKTNVIFGADCP